MQCRPIIYSLVIASAVGQVMWPTRTEGGGITAAPVGVHATADNTTSRRRLTSYTPFVYGGGPVMRAPVVYPIFYGSWSLSNQQILLDSVRAYVAASGSRTWLRRVANVARTSSSFLSLVPTVAHTTVALFPQTRPPTHARMQFTAMSGSPWLNIMVRQRAGAVRHERPTMRLVRVQRHTDDVLRHNGSLSGHVDHRRVRV